MYRIKKLKKRARCNKRAVESLIMITTTPRPEFARELYRPSDHRLSAKLMPTFANRGVLRSQRGGSTLALMSVF
jgi:hypothetical protein